MPKATKARRAEAGRAPQESNTRILIVDDHPIVRMGLAEWLNRIPGLEVAADADGFQAATKRLREQTFDLAIVDITLDGISGIDLIKHIAQAHGELPVLALSMHDEKIYAERAMRAGAKGYVMKQAPPDQVLKAIRTILDGRIYLSEAIASNILSQLVTGKPSASQSPVEKLSDRQLEIFELLGQGRSTRQIAEGLCIGVSTVETHRKFIKDKLRINTNAELILRASQWMLQEQNGSSLPHHQAEPPAEG